MAASAQGGGRAADATADTRDDTPEAPSNAQQDYLNGVAEDAESAVSDVEQTIAHLKESLADRKTAAREARVAATKYGKE